jgi:hypothetical protein
LEHIELRDGHAIQNPNIWIVPEFMTKDKFEKATVARIKWQTKKSKFINLTSCICQDMPEHIQLFDANLQERAATTSHSPHGMHLDSPDINMVSPIMENSMLSTQLEPNLPKPSKEQTPPLHSDVNMEQTDEQGRTEGNSGFPVVELSNIEERATAPTQC